MKASDILDLLATKHSGDVFVPECKNGPTHGGSHLRLDAWAMARSWSNPNTYGYEIKVSRSDFLNDKKWTLYLPYCSHFSFAVAPGVCEPSELPDGIGLLVASKTGTRLFTKRKAAYREVAIPEDIWRYVLMCRTKVCDEYAGDDRNENLSYWRHWLTEKREALEIGHKVSKAVRTRYTEDVTEVKLENHRLTKAMEGYDEIAKFCAAIGITPHEWMTEDRLRTRAASMRGELPDDVRQAIEAIDSASDTLRRFKFEADRIAGISPVKRKKAKAGGGAK